MKALTLTISILMSQLAFAQNANSLRCFNQVDVSAESPYLVFVQGILSAKQLKKFNRELVKTELVKVENVQILAGLDLTVLALSAQTENLAFPAVLGFDIDSAIDSGVERAIATAADLSNVTSYTVECNFIVDGQPKAGGMN
ncbi:MAG: hypothetical protein ACK5WZ_07620 [Pseudobdellovibrionaceae bacterium]